MAPVLAHRRTIARITVVAVLAALFAFPFAVERPAFAVTPETTVQVIEGLGDSAAGGTSSGGALSDGEEAHNSSPSDEGAAAGGDEEQGEPTPEGGAPEEEPGTEQGDPLEGSQSPESSEGEEADSEGPGPVAEGEAEVSDGIHPPVATDEPFSMIGFESPVEGRIWFRVSNDGAQWEPWEEAEFLSEEDGPDPAESATSEDVTRFTDAAWVAEASHFQVRLEGISPNDLRIHLIDSMGLSRTLSQKLIDLGKALLESPMADPAEATMQPAVVTRSQWGADESLRRNSPSYASRLDFAVVHHTAGSNSYTRAQAPGIVRGIYAYHTQSLRWNDIGYNVLVDRFGTVYEGRFGGLDRLVVGAHAAGFNTGSFGISLMGNHEIAPPTSISIDRMNSMIAWKFGLHGVDPNKKPSRTGVDHAVIGHRDVGSTACPGRFVHQQMSTIRSTVAARTVFGVSVIGSHRPPSGAVPLTGDWNGDGLDTPGWFHNGQWALYNRDTGVRLLSYGRAGDIPVAGDWNGDGVDTVGVVREQGGHLYFILRYVFRSGADIVLRYGRSGDIPVTGDWNGDGIDTLGVVRTDPDGRLRFILRYLYRSGADITLHFGRTGDVPVTGDFNGDGRDTLGVRRGKTFILRYVFRSGADIVMDYGRVGDHPVVGDWNGDGTDTLGIRRDDLWALRYVYRSGADVIYRW